KSYVQTGSRLGPFDVSRIAYVNRLCPRWGRQAEVLLVTARIIASPREQERIYREQLAPTPRPDNVFSPAVPPIEEAQRKLRDTKVVFDVRQVELSQGAMEQVERELLQPGNASGEPPVLTIAQTLRLLRMAQGDRASVMRMPSLAVFHGQGGEQKVCQSV